MSNNFWETYQEEIAQGQTENSWLQKCQKISSESKLYLMACLQLASKMDCFSNGLGVSKVNLYSNQFFKYCKCNFSQCFID